VGPLRLVRQGQSFQIAQQLAVAVRECAPTRDQIRKPFELFSPDGSLHVRHPVVETNEKVVLEDDWR
jgi:hypothetical protein